MYEKFINAVSYLYVGLITATFMLTLYNSENWWLLIFSIVSLHLVIYLVSRESRKQKK